ncbi:MAG TPA: TonB-dependent receptor [Longimicrobiales bacterium]|nr:TonB-dependent receptor [Longimicrobiales bacterium]
MSGTVRTAEGSPVAAAFVSVSGVAERSAETNAAGVFRLRVPPGQYTLRIEAVGFGASTRPVDVPAAGLRLDVVLEASAYALAPLQVVAATRTGTSAATLPIKVEVIDRAEIGVQQTLSSNPTEMLSNLIPSFSPARQKLSTAGESFRGRRPLFLIDGVPQSNPLRDGRRDGFTIDTEVIERVEVVFGANAIQGLGATGGIINYVTVRPPLSGALEQRASLAATSGDAWDGDGLGWRAHYSAAKRVGELDVLGAVSYEQRGLQYDAEGRPIGVDNVQGDVADSRAYNVLGKFGWQPAAGQRLQLMVNDFRLKQDGNFETVAGDRSAGIPAVAVEGNPEGVEPINDVTTVALDYENSGFAGGSLSAKAYYQDFAALYGGGRFDSFQDPAIAPVGELFDQSENNSEKLGARLTYARSRVADTRLDVIAGFDVLRDRTYQRLVHTDRNWVPETNFVNYAPFVQLDLQAHEWVSLSAGARWEIAQLDVDDFTTLAGNRDDFQRIEVAGGSPSFDEPLFNVGAVVTPLPELRVYGTLSQAYTMPDVGRVLRGVSEPGTAVADFLALEPIKTDNREVGAALGSRMGRIGVTYFESESDYGYRLVPNTDGIFQVMREPTRTSGWEANVGVDPLRHLSLTAAYSRLDGSYDGDGDGELESDLGAADIGPDRLNLTADINRSGRVRGRLQSFTYFDETFRDGTGAETARFDGYTTLDGSVAADVGISTVTLSVSNLFDEQYITYFGQAATNLADRYFAGRGRTLTLRVDTRF